MTDSSGVPISPSEVSKPELTLSAASVNDEPAELDGTPTSPDKARRGSRAAALEDPSLAEQEKRQKLIAERKSDPAVLVDIPQTPGPEELDKSGAIEGGGNASSTENEYHVDTNATIGKPATSHSYSA